LSPWSHAVFAVGCDEVLDRAVSISARRISLARAETQPVPRELRLEPVRCTTLRARSSGPGSAGDASLKTRSQGARRVTDVRRKRAVSGAGLESPGVDHT
jgi:hypothetical protein